MSHDRKALGNRGESSAVAFLQAHGFKILETNFWTRAAEIDIIAMDHETLCFIEVKTRRSIKKGLPKESITRSKQNKIILGASFYLRKNRLLESKIRFDVIEVLEKDDQFEFNLIKHAFQAG